MGGKTYAVPQKALFTSETATILGLREVMNFQHAGKPCGNLFQIVRGLELYYSSFHFRLMPVIRVHVGIDALPRSAASAADLHLFTLMLRVSGAPCLQSGCILDILSGLPRTLVWHL